MLTTIFSKKVGEVVFYTYGNLTDQIKLEYEKQFKETIGISNVKSLFVKFIDKGWIIKDGDNRNSRYFLGEFL